MGNGMAGLDTRDFRGMQGGVGEIPTDARSDDGLICHTSFEYLSNEIGMRRQKALIWNGDCPMLSPRTLLW